MRSSGALLPLLVLAVAVVGACGGEDDEEAIRETIRSSLTSTEPDDCAGRDTTTASFRRQYAFGSAALARQYEKLCRAEIEKLAATSVRVFDVEVDGDRAQAGFSAMGGQYVLADARVQLRRDDDRWRLDRFSTVKLERDAFDAQQVKLATGGRLGFSREDAACFARRLKRVSDAALERAIAQPDPAVFTDPLLICFVRPKLREYGLSNRRTRCVILRLRREADEVARIALAAASARADQSELQDLVVRAATACMD